MNGKVYESDAIFALNFISKGSEQTNTVFID